MMELKGRVIQDLGMQEGVSKAGNNWRKKEWVVETVDTQFPRKVKLTCFGDRAETVRLEIGKIFIIGIEVESREFQGRWYTDVNAFSAREDMMGQQPQANAPMNNLPPFGQPQQPAGFTTQQPMGAQSGMADPMGADGSDDLPF